MEELPKIFGDVIRARRQKAGVSQEQFAHQAGVHRTYMSSIERGKVSITITVAQQLAAALNVPLSRIWRDVEKEMPKQE